MFVRNARTARFAVTDDDENENDGKGDGNSNGDSIHLDAHDESAVPKRGWACLYGDAVGRVCMFVCMCVCV